MHPSGTPPAPLPTSLSLAACAAAGTIRTDGGCPHHPQPPWAVPVYSIVAGPDHSAMDRPDRRDSTASSSHRRDPGSGPVDADIPAFVLPVRSLFGRDDADRTGIRAENGPPSRHDAAVWSVRPEFTIGKMRF